MYDDIQTSYQDDTRAGSDYFHQKVFHWYNIYLNVPEVGTIIELNVELWR